MPHVVFLPVPMWGHVQPCLALMRGLRAQGIEVTAFVPEQFAAAVRATGAQVVDIISSVEDPRAPGCSSGTDFVALGLKWADEARAVVPQILEIARRLRPAAVVGCSLSLAARCLAHQIGCMHVQLFPSYPANEHFNLAAASLDRAGGPGMATWSDLQRALTLLSEDLGIRAISVSEVFQDGGDLNLVAIPPFLVPDASSFASSHIFVGPLHDGNVDGFAAHAGNVPGGDLFSALPAITATGALRVYVSLGTVYSDDPAFYRGALEAFGGCAASPWRMVIATGRSGVGRALGTCPENSLVVDRVQQESVLEGCDVFVTHGGMNGVLQALRLQVPMVVLPRTDEQRMTAGRLQQLGAAIWLPQAHPTPVELREAVLAAAQSPQIRSSLATLATQLDVGGIETAISCLVERLTARLPHRGHNSKPAYVH